MYISKSPWLLLALISTCAAHGCKKICVLDNLECVTRGGFDVYKNVVKGVKGLLKPIDPLYINEIDGVIESVKYKLTNITMKGLKDCTVTKLKLNVTDSTFKQYLSCPKLMSHFHFKADENSNSPALRLKYYATITAYDYDILNLGKYSVFVKAHENRPHFFILNHQTKTHIKGKLVFELSDGCVMDSRIANETETYMNQHWKETEHSLHSYIVKKAMDILINNIDIYIRAYDMGEVLPLHKPLITKKWWLVH
ncbi:unnamed protein product [Arctia plantaginis]|uniref:Uncharacterized protein n=1 Tax=Arctia plantaginis TaxID=874455 RepID=A0A8S1AMH6_ARCPL|nr:unnamed protein product [Arctia plantaginis]